MWLQWLLAVSSRSNGKPRLGFTDVARTSFVVLPTDIDFLGHMNNGRYPSYMDLARVDWSNRTGASAVFANHNLYAVMSQVTLAYRRSLNLGQRFDIETAFVGIDERAIYMEQRFVVRGEVWARGVAQGRYLQKGAGTVKTARLLEVLEAGGIDAKVPELDPDIAAWARGNALPPSRAEAPSDWVGRVPR